MRHSFVDNLTLFGGHATMCNLFTDKVKLLIHRSKSFDSLSCGIKRNIHGPPQCVSNENVFPRCYLVGTVHTEFTISCYSCHDLLVSGLCIQPHPRRKLKTRLNELPMQRQSDGKPRETGLTSVSVVRVRSGLRTALNKTDSRGRQIREEGTKFNANWFEDAVKK
ncbi:hypothetical protein K0M31_009753 [Melipona bicolor]|uniref:Uncharacterized protein n=1 Tax=Melipona bicolor TaxID=60889 RepID=A0AA40FMH1_9HYME|nr:hypothetical protein K0M31_009753 [Melipona bicolor]